jgi:cytidine diphosphoramidate kinase
MIIWVIGLAGAGKSTIGQLLYQRLKADDRATLFLDGDHVREIMGNDLGHTLEDRRANGWRICRLCQYLDRQGITVVCSILSLFEEQREWNRKSYSNYFEVFIDVPLATLRARDQKGLYSGAAAGRTKNVAGVDLPFVPPQHPDLVVRNDGDLAGLGELVQQIETAIAVATAKS